MERNCGWKSAMKILKNPLEKIESIERKAFFSLRSLHYYYCCCWLFLFLLLFQRDNRQEQNIFRIGISLSIGKQIGEATWLCKQWIEWILRVLSGVWKAGSTHTHCTLQARSCINGCTGPHYFVEMNTIFTSHSPRVYVRTCAGCRTQ